MTVMTTILRRHGAAMTLRHGRLVAAHFGSIASEVAVCRSHAGLAERSDRATLEVRGPKPDVDAALAELVILPDRVWWARLSLGRAIVRCDGPEQDACTSAMLRAEGVAIDDVGADYAAFEVIGPLTDEVLRAAAIDDQQDPVIVVREGVGDIELLVRRAHGPALWHRLLQAGEPFGITTVGIDALEQLAASVHASALRHPAR